MTTDELPITVEELESGLADAPGRTDDEVPVTLDGRRLDSRDAVLAWCADVEREIAAGHSVTLADGSRV